jgi:hypothetical protein
LSSSGQTHAINIIRTVFLSLVVGLSVGVLWASSGVYSVQMDVKPNILVLRNLPVSTEALN